MRPGLGARAGRIARVAVPCQCCWFPQHNRPGFHLVSHRILRNLGDFHWKKQDNCSAACSLQGPRGCEAAQAPGAMAAVVAGGGLQITRIAAYRACLPLLEGRYRWGDGKFVDVFDTTVVRVETNVPGLVGHGENCPLGANYLPMFPAATRAGISELAPHLLGHDPTRLGALNSRMDWLMTGQPAPKSAIDMACWDILGKVAGLPVCELLGERHTDEGYDLYRAISQDAAEAMAQNVRQYVEEGYSKFQLKVGGRPHEDIERIRAVRAVLDAQTAQTGQYHPLICDANAGWLRHEALQVVNSVRNLDVYIEMPCATYDECQTVREHTHLPFILDECIQDIGMMVRILSDRSADGEYVNGRLTA